MIETKKRIRAGKPKGFLYLPGWLYDLFLGLLLRGVRRRVSLLFPAGDSSRGLDICCGTGSQCRIVQRRGKRAFGLDRSFGMLRYAASRSRFPSSVCGDALDLPFRDSSFNTILLSFALHDKAPGDRIRIMTEAKRVLEPRGKMIFVDFEPAWNKKSRWGIRFTSVIERLAGNPHYSNGREFVRSGGLRAFLRENGLEEMSRSDHPMGALSIVVASPGECRPPGHPKKEDG
jgi:demethylmenaquinone methyltransferase/2-methoxy-6-polyprenyl-1,4-benzoquinol methylase